MELWANLTLDLIVLKPHKRPYFQRGFDCSIPYEMGATLLVVGSMI